LIASDGARRFIPIAQARGFRAAFFDKLAVDDLHSTKDLSQRIDSVYITIVTLLLSADGYEIATSQYHQWAPTVATFCVALIGIAVTARWRQGADNLFKIVKNRYQWLRDAERSQQHPEMAHIGADIFTHEFGAVYKNDRDKRVNGKKGNGKKTGVKYADEDEEDGERSASIFHERTVFLQTLCLIVFPAVPAIIGVFTYLSLNHAVFQAIQSALP
jgi:hypothetical protein